MTSRTDSTLQIIREDYPSAVQWEKARDGQLLLLCGELIAPGGIHPDLEVEGQTYALHRIAPAPAIIPGTNDSRLIVSFKAI